MKTLSEILAMPNPKGPAINYTEQPTQADVAEWQGYQVDGKKFKTINRAIKYIRRGV